MKRSTYTLRRLLALVLVLVMVGSLFAGCSKKVNDPTLPEEPSETNAATVAPTDAATDAATEAPTEEPTEAPTEPVETVPPVLMGTVNADNLNVRSEPYSTADILKRLAINTRIEILEQKIVDGVNWGRIAEGWINLNYVTIGVEFPGSDTNTDDNTVVNNQSNIGSGSVTTNNTTTGVTTTGLNIRKESNANATAVGTYAKGTKVTILERSNGWGRTDKGWINLDYVDFSGKTTATSTGSSSSGTNSSTVSNGNSVPLGNGTVVKTTSLAIRSGPGANYTQVSYIRMGETHDYFQTSSNGWVRMKKGWVNADYLDLEYYVEDGTEVTVTASELTVREEANYNSNKLHTYEKGDEITILEVKGTWGMVEYTSGQYGWVDLDKVKLPTPVASNYSTGVATITADALHIREKASASSESLGIYEKGDKVDVLEVKGNWGRTEDGWINLKYTKMTTVYSTGTGYITASKLNVRELPDEDSDKIGSLSNGDKVIILDTESGWGKIEYKKNEYGWISLKYVKLTSTSTESSSSSSSKYKITIETPDNGVIKASTSSASKGTKVTLTATPASGFTLNTVTVVDAKGVIVDVTNNSFIMPDANVTVTATFKTGTTPSKYSVGIVSVANGYVYSNPYQATQGTKITLSINPDATYALSSIKVEDSNGNTVNVSSDYTFIMPASDVTITPAFEKTSGTLYNVGFDSLINGDVIANTTSVAKNGKVTLKIVPDEGYSLKSISVKDESDKTVSLSGTGTTRTFTMPASNVIVYTEFEANQYKVNVTSTTGVSITPSSTQCAFDTPVTVTAAPSSNYVLMSLKIYGPNNQLLFTDDDNDGVINFNMPSQDVTVKAVVKKFHTITIGTISNGTVTASQTIALAGETITLSGSTTEFSYELKTLKVNNEEITGTSFVMPDEDVKITGAFKFASKKYLVNCTDGKDYANIREEADSSGKDIGDVPNGKIVSSKSGSTSQWIKITYGGVTGFVNINHLVEQS